MPLDHLAIDEISKDHLQALIDNGVAEGRDIDFKAQSWGTTDNDKREFLADISSFANTVGGHLVVGIREDGGIARELVGTEIDPDKERLKLEQVARDGLQPRLSGLQIAGISLTNGRHALVIRVPRSWNPPHRVIAQGSNRFWARAGNGKYQPDVDQLRELFAVAPTLAEKIHDFRFDRLAKIKAAETPLGDFPNGALVLHLIPYDAFSRTRRLGVPELRAAAQNVRLLGTKGIFFDNLSRDERPNLNGLLILGMQNASPQSYVQLWRTGPIEAACKITFKTSRADKTPYINIQALENACVTAVEAYASGFQRLGIAPPCAMFVTLLGLHQQLFYVNGKPDLVLEHDRKSFHDHDVLTSDVALEDWPHDRQAVARLLRPAFDEIANAAGRDASPPFDAHGQWVVDGSPAPDHP